MIIQMIHRLNYWFVTANVAMISGQEKSKNDGIKRKRNQFSYCEDGHCNKEVLSFSVPSSSRECSFQTKSKSPLNEWTEDELIITGFRFNLYKSTFIGILFILTAGLLWLFLYWMPKIRLRFTHDVVDLDLADTVLVEVRIHHVFSICKQFIIKAISIWYDVLIVFNSL